MFYGNWFAAQEGRRLRRSRATHNRSQHQQRGYSILGNSVIPDELRPRCLPQILASRQSTGPARRRQPKRGHTTAVDSRMRSSHQFRVRPNSAWNGKMASRTMCPLAAPLSSPKVHTPGPPFLVSVAASCGIATTFSTISRLDQHAREPSNTRSAVTGQAKTTRTRQRHHARK